MSSILKYISLGDINNLKFVLFRNDSMDVNE